MNTLIVNAVARALAARTAGRRLRRVGLLSERELALVLVGGTGQGMVVLAAEPGLPHVRFEAARSLNRRLTDQLGDAPTLLAGAVIADVGIVGCERILAITLIPREIADDRTEAPRAAADKPAAAAPPLALYFEMLPRTPFIVVTAAGSIVAAFRPPGTRRADGRRMARGGSYELPFDLGPPEAQPDFRTALASRLAGATPTGAAFSAAAAELLRGVPPPVIERIVAGAATPGEAADRLHGFAGPLAVATGADGAPELTAGVAAVSGSETDPLAVMAEWAMQRREHERTVALRTAAGRALRAARDKTARARRALAKDRRELGDPAHLRRMGEILLAHLAHVPRSAQSVELADPYADGASCVIPLDPRRSPAGNAEAYFQAARRAARAREQLAAREREIAEREAHIGAAMERLAECRDVPALVAELASQGLVPSDLEAPDPAGPAAVARRGGKPERLPYRSYPLGNGWEIRVGRSAADNDVLTHELAHPRDLWLHVHGASGSHVILRRSDGAHAPPPAVMVSRAASAAAYFSEARHSRLVPVTVTERRYVRRPRRSPPGTAVCLREKTVMAEPRRPAVPAAKRPPSASQ